MSTRLIWLNVFRYLLLVAVQVLLLNHLNLGSYLNPSLYCYFILLLPFRTAGWLLLVISFVLGITVDLFTNTPGLNAAACVAMAFFRPYLITMLSRGTDYTGDSPSLHSQGMQWFFYYSATLVFIHHFILFYLEIFRFQEFFNTLLRVITSSLFTMVLIFLAEYLFRRKDK